MDLIDSDSDTSEKIYNESDNHDDDDDENDDENDVDDDDDADKDNDDGNYSERLVRDFPELKNITVEKLLYYYLTRSFFETITNMTNLYDRQTKMKYQRGRFSSNQSFLNVTVEEIQKYAGILLVSACASLPR